MFLLVSFFFGQHTVFFAQISSFTQQATLPDALTAEECEYKLAFAVLCMITLF